jgi:uncharacterized flavoprotein (TIGR03862 family)
MTKTAQQTAAVIGAGPAGLMAADVLSKGGVAVTVYEQMPSVGRKFLLAGRGGLNLTHSEPLDAFMTRYGARSERLRDVIEQFSPDKLRAWADALGAETFVGSSGRVFPKAMKASPLLRAWLRALDAQGVTLKLRHHWQGWRDGQLLFDTPEGETPVLPDITVLALGGASWPHLGSNGQWTRVLTEAGAEVEPLKPANSAFLVDWSETFRTRFAGQPLKSIALAFDGRSVRGEAMITTSGIEGGAVYALSSALRDAVLTTGEATLNIALRPDLAAHDIVAKLGKSRGKQSLSTYLRKALNLSPAAIGLLQEVSIAAGVSLATLTPQKLASLVNRLPVRLQGVAPIDRAISSAGGVTFASLDDAFMLRQQPGVFLAGEMLDWEAPTGGYLLQACFATGAAAGEGALKWLGSRQRSSFRGESKASGPGIHTGGFR